MLNVEDGTGLANADSYVSVAIADAYHLSMGNALWTGTNAQKEVALRKATQYIDATYMFPSQRLKYSQSLEFPRVSYSFDFFPLWPIKKLSDATCELAVRALTTNLTADVQPDGNIKREKVGPLETEWFRSDTGGQTIFTLATNLLRGLAYGSRSSARIERTS